MKCPICGGKTKVVDSRKNNGDIRRVRVCSNNKYHRFPTMEIFEYEVRDFVERNGFIKLDTVLELLKKHACAGFK